MGQSHFAKDNSSRAVGSVQLKDVRRDPVRQLKDVLGEIQSDGADLVRGRLLEWALPPPLWHADAVGGRPHHQGPLGNSIQYRMVVRRPKMVAFLTAAP